MFAGTSGLLTKRPENVSTYEGQSVNFTCVTNNTIPVNWELKNGTTYKLFFGGAVAMKFDRRIVVRSGTVDGDYTLTILSVKLSDVGMYTCIDRAGSGPDNSSATLLVQGKNYSIVFQINTAFYIHILFIYGICNC